MVQVLYTSSTLKRSSSIVGLLNGFFDSVAVSSWCGLRLASPQSGMPGWGTNTQGERSRVTKYTWRHCTREIVTWLGVPSSTHPPVQVPCSMRQLHCWRQSHPPHHPRKPTQPLLRLCPSSQPTRGRHCCHSLSVPSAPLSCHALYRAQTAGQEPSTCSDSPVTGHSGCPGAGLPLPM